VCQPFLPLCLCPPDTYVQVQCIGVRARIRDQRHASLRWRPVSLSVVAWDTGSAQVQRVVRAPSRARDYVVDRQLRRLFHCAAVLAAVGVAEKNADSQITLALVLANVDIDL